MKSLILSTVVGCVPMVGCKTVNYDVCGWHRTPLTKSTYYYFPVGGTFTHRDVWICATCEEERPGYWNPPPDCEPSPYRPQEFAE